MAQTARVTVTLSNIATEEDINNLEEKMSQLSDAITALREQVENLSVAQSPEKVSELQAALQAERDANAALLAKAAEVASAEELEDTEQQRALDEAKAASDALIAEMNSAAGDLGTITAQLAAVGTAVDDAPDETPVSEVPVEVPSSDAEVQAPATDVDAPSPTAGPTPDPSSPTIPDAGVTPDGGAPEDAAPAASAGGPVDASGKPVDGPNL